MDHSKPCRSAAAAATGPSTKLTSLSPHRIVNGVPNGTGPNRPDVRQALRAAPAGPIKG
jgi:hypothetical protein